MCCSNAYPDHEEIYQDLIRGKQHLLHCHEDLRTPSGIGIVDHTKSGGMKYDIIGKSFDGTFQDIEGTTKKDDTFDGLAFDNPN